METRWWKRQWQYFITYLGNRALNIKTKDHDKKRKIATSTAHHWGWKRDKRKSKEIKSHQEERGSQGNIASKATLTIEKEKWTSELDD